MRIKVCGLGFKTQASKGCHALGFRVLRLYALGFKATNTPQTLFPTYT